MESVEERESTDQAGLDQRLEDGRPQLGSALGDLRARVVGAVVRRQPKTIGRYVLGRTIGSGNFGTVFEAHDPQLDRRVAVKQVTVRSPTERARVVREAQLLASLSHPNVVSVFEVGVTDDERASPYLVMELVEGQTLREWLAAESRSWSEVVAVNLQAARGLHAAHQAGIVHRDFKPDNALLGTDGRVRVLDFGLARAIDDHDASTLSAPDSMTRASVLHTQTGSVLGTPAYMAPEAFAGTVTPRTDQYALCVTLYEGLFGTRPFMAKTLDELMKLVHREAPALPRDRRGVPTPIGTALLRGLARDADDRFEDMGALIDAMETGGRTGHSRTTLVAGICGVGALALGLAFASGALDSSGSALATPPATDETKAEEDVDPQRVAAIERLDAQLALLRDEIATAKLDAALERSASVLELAGELDDEKVHVEPKLLRGRALMLATDYQHALPMLEQAYFLARDHDQPRHAAEAASQLVAVLGYHTDRYEDAHRWKGHAEVSYERAGLDPRQQVSYMTGVAGLMTRERDAPGAIATLREILGHVEKDERAGTSAHAGLLKHLARELFYEGQIELAIETHRKALPLFAANDGPRSPSYAAALDNLGVFLTSRDEFEDALVQHREALEIREAILGPEHIDLARSHGNMGRILGKLGRRTEALDHLDRSIELFAARLGPGNSSVAMGHQLKGEIHAERGPDGRDDALREYAQAARLYDGAGVIYAPSAQRMREAIRTLGGTPPPAPSVSIPPEL